jgi:hypothetical protein
VCVCEWVFEQQNSVEIIQHSSKCVR